ncbi:MAG: hypothetical protein JNK49_11065 [Planctomycetes bacterium]|nr:hypothetical protein [Planctomycetota bacterium]
MPVVSSQVVSRESGNVAAPDRPSRLAQAAEPEPRVPASTKANSVSSTAKVSFVTAAVALFVSAIVGVLGSHREAARRAEDLATNRRELAVALAERCAPLLPHRDRKSLQSLAGIGRDLAQGRLLVLDLFGRVHADSAQLLVGRVVDAMALPGGGVVERLRMSDPDAGDDAVWLAETAVPIRFGGEIVGELRLQCEPAPPGPSWDAAWFSLCLLACLSIVVVAAAMTQYWVQRLRCATQGLLRLATGETAGVLQDAPAGEFRDFSAALAELDRGVQDGLQLVAVGYQELALQLVLQLERQGFAPAGRGQRCAELAGRFADHLHLVAADRRDLVLAAKLLDLGSAFGRTAGNLVRERSGLPQGVAPTHQFVRGAEQLDCMPPLRSCARLLRHVDERFDGKGGPDGLRGSAIPLGARILAIVVAYDRHLQRRMAESPATKNGSGKRDAPAGAAQSAWQSMLQEGGDALDPWLTAEFAAVVGVEPRMRDKEVWIVPPGAAGDPAADEFALMDGQVDVIPDEREEDSH